MSPKLTLSLHGFRVKNDRRAFKDIAFVSGDKWHRKFVDEVPLFEKVRGNFMFVDLTTKTTIQGGFSKLL